MSEPVTIEWLDHLVSYDPGKSEAAPILAWLRKHVDIQIGWVDDIRVDWQNKTVARVHVHCAGDVSLSFDVNLETQTYGPFQYVW